MERAFKDAVTIQNFRSGLLGPYMQPLAEGLWRQGYARHTVRIRLRIVNHFGQWLTRHRIPLEKLTSRVVRSYVRLYGTGRNGETRTLKRLLEILVNEGRVALPKTRPSAIDSAVRDYAEFLEEVRGLAPSTIKHYGLFAKMFLDWCSASRCAQLPSIEAKDLIAFVQRQASKWSTKTTQLLSSGLRSFVRHLLARGILRRDLSGVLPAVHNPRYSGIPKSLARPQVESVLASCNRKTPAGRRDYAVLLLLARLGLRAAEVATLSLDDIDWSSGTLIIRGKAGKTGKLPLPHDVGKAIARYLHKDRPPVASRRVFLLTCAPYAPFNGRRSVCEIVSSAMIRAGVRSNSKGAHQFRHTLATHALTHGGSLADVREILRHENIETTFIYAKLDLESLRPLARPWVGGAQ